jgi:hypothetical protein
LRTSLRQNISSIVMGNAPQHFFIKIPLNTQVNLKVNFLLLKLRSNKLYKLITLCYCETPIPKANNLKVTIGATELVS